ncbi:hypothetical protein HHI36_009824 [Cryptolaemus montrouzieri]|uniref:Uncharacterized protein n=1 Tax=Cryptolaemus montrouzieri TaxID=559131 RepID=A0ABD2MH15_9CUCU
MSDSFLKILKLYMNGIASALSVVTILTELDYQQYNEASDQGTVNVTPDLVRPYPKAGRMKLNSMKRKKGKTGILTDKPGKRLKEMEKEKKSKCSKNTGQKTILKLCNESTSKPEKNRKISSDDE